MPRPMSPIFINRYHKAAVDEVVAAGAKAASNQEIGESCDVVLTMLPNSPHVKAGPSARRRITKISPRFFAQP